MIRTILFLILFCLSLHKQEALSYPVKAPSAFKIIYFSDGLEISKPLWIQNRPYHEVISLLSPNYKNQMINFINKLPKNATVLDIGFGEGVFLEQLKLERPDITTVGATITAWEYPPAKSIDEIYIQHIPEDITLLKNRLGTIDLITDVFGAATYAENPLRAIIYSAMLLKPGGRYYAVSWLTSKESNASPFGLEKKRAEMVHFFKKKLGIDLHFERKETKVKLYMIGTLEVLSVSFEKPKNQKPFTLNNYLKLIDEADHAIGVPVMDKAWGTGLDTKFRWASRNYIKP